MPEHKDSPYCGCWGCINQARQMETGFVTCVVHAVAEPDSEPPLAENGLNLCGSCNDRMIKGLREVAAGWDLAQSMLSPHSGGGSDRHAQRTEAPLPINASVSDALRVVRDNIWSVALKLVDDYEVGLPEDQTTPGLAEWMARTQAVVIAGAADRRFSQLAYWWIDDARGWMLSATHGAETSVEIPDQYCKRPGCGAQLLVVENRKGERIVQCQGDAKHAVQWDTWTNMLKSLGAQKRRGPRLPQMRR